MCESFIVIVIYPNDNDSHTNAQMGLSGSFCVRKGFHFMRILYWIRLFIDKVFYYTID